MMQELVATPTPAAVDEGEVTAVDEDGTAPLVVAVAAVVEDAAGAKVVALAEWLVAEPQPETNAAVEMTAVRATADPERRSRPATEEQLMLALLYIRHLSCPALLASATSSTRDRLGLSGGRLGLSGGQWSAFGLVDSQLGGRITLEPLVWYRPGATHRTTVGARGKSLLGPLDRP